MRSQSTVVLAPHGAARRGVHTKGGADTGRVNSTRVSYVSSPEYQKRFVTDSMKGLVMKFFPTRARYDHVRYDRRGYRRGWWGRFSRFGRHGW
jgi:hypothetical protein